jgi:cysteine synthase A
LPGCKILIQKNNKEQMRIADNITELTGNSPMVRLNRLTKNCVAEVLVKLESLNPSFSVKDRAVLAMITDAEKKGVINPKSTIIEPSSGNTGIALAMLCAVKGYKLIIVMPENMSIERRKLISAFGAEVILTPTSAGMNGAVEKAEMLAKEIPGSFIPFQFSNPANPDIHKRTTAIEIYNDTDGKADFIVAGIGSGGTISGTAEILKEKIPGIKAIGVEPAESPVISGGKASAHKIQGIGAGFIPVNLNTKILDEIITVASNDAIATAKKVIREEGILCGISSGANVFAALSIAAREENRGKRVITFICDSAERYLSTELFN